MQIARSTSAPVWIVTNATGEQFSYANRHQAYAHYLGGYPLSEADAAEFINRRVEVVAENLLRRVMQILRADMLPVLDQLHAVMLVNNLAGVVDGTPAGEQVGASTWTKERFVQVLQALNATNEDGWLFTPDPITQVTPHEVFLYLD